MHSCKCFLCYFLAWEQLKAYVMLCYVKKTKSVVVYCVLTGLIQTHKSLRDGLILYGGHVQKRWCNGKSTEEKGTRKPNLYAYE